MKKRPMFMFSLIMSLPGLQELWDLFSGWARAMRPDPPPTRADPIPIALMILASAMIVLGFMTTLVVTGIGFLIVSFVDICFDWQLFWESNSPQGFPSFGAGICLIVIDVVRIARLLIVA